MKIGFAILASDPLFSKVIDIENRYHDQAGFFDMLSKDGNLPHTTLFQGEMSDDIDYAKIADAVAGRILQEGVNEMQFVNVSYVPEGWYFLDSVKTPFLIDLHMLTLEMVKPYIVLSENRLKRKTDFMPRNQIDALEKYGYRYSETAFYPHITIGRTSGFDKELLMSLNDEFGKIDLVTKIDCVSVYQMGNNGTHSRTLYQRRLK